MKEGKSLIAIGGSLGLIYPWGDEPPDAQRCNFEDKVGSTTPVGSYSPQGDSPYGCLDMAGNVWEWCSSWYGPYPYRPNDGREDLDTSDDRSRVLRGGSFFDPRAGARCAARYWALPGYDWHLIGFRCLVSPIS